MSDTGYSGTPLAKKLGFKDGMTAITLNSPQLYADYFPEIPDIRLAEDTAKPQNVDFIHIFCSSFEQLDRQFASLKQALKKTGLMWISWPKATSKIETDITRESLRSYVLERGLVDVKVCAIDKDWSALKFVFRLQDR
jgi:hypothetical protein